MSTLSLIIPAYNEEKRLGPFLERIAVYHTKHPAVLTEILVVDDGSTDQTRIVAQKYQSALPQLRVISYRPNRGKGAAIKEGVFEALGELIVFMDADGATDIEELPKMLAALENADIAVGNRWFKQSQTDRSSVFRHFAGWVNHTYMKLAGLGDIDTMCGFKGYQREVARSLFADLRNSRWLFDTEIAYRAILRQLQVKNFPIKWESKEGSKLTSVDLLQNGLQILPLLYQVRQEEKSLKKQV